MIRFYLLLNAALYAGLALWCTVKPAETSRGTGYLTLSNGGHSEYLVIYGGLQLGLAAFYTYLGANPPLYRTGVIFSLLLYLPIVAYRLVTVLRHWPVGGITLATGALETALLLGGFIALLKAR